MSSAAMLFIIIIIIAVNHFSELLVFSVKVGNIVSVYCSTESILFLCK